MIFSGRNGSDLTGGSRGGNAGVLNISVPDLINTSRMNLYGLGGYSTVNGAGGAGGKLQLNYHGLILNWSGALGSNPNIGILSLTAGSSTNSTSGASGSLIYNKDSKIPKDPDVNDDGYVAGGDRDLVRGSYNNVTADSTFSTAYDINNDGRISVIDLVRVGFERNTRQTL